MTVPSDTIAPEPARRPGRLDFMGAPFDLAADADVVQALRERTETDPFGYVVTPNVDHVVRLAGRPDLAPAYRSALMSWCDSRPIQGLARLAGVGLPHRTGADMTERILRDIAQTGDRITCILADSGLLGDLRARYPHLAFAGHCPPMGLDTDPDACAACVRFVLQHPARFVFFGVGSPRSELLAEAVMKTGMGTGTGLCTGAALEFVVGRKRRAPRALRTLGLEWLYRLASEPRRLWRRYALSALPLMRLFGREMARARSRRRPQLLHLAPLVATLGAGAQACLWADPASPNPTFQRGINVSHLFVFPTSGWPPFRGDLSKLSDLELVRMAAIGLDFIRLPVDPTPFITASKEQRGELRVQIVDFVRRANAAGLSVMVAGYTTDGALAWRPEREIVEGGQTFDDYAEWMEWLAVALEQAAPGGVAIQLMNEPQGACVAASGTDWAVYQERLHSRLRNAMDLPIVLTGGCWSRIAGLERLDPIPDDPNTLFDVHYYEPFVFTHQATTWAGPVLAYVGGLRFPPRRTDLNEVERIVDSLLDERPDETADERAAARLWLEAMSEVLGYLRADHGPATIRQDIARLASWAAARGIEPQRIVVGEFGAMTHDFATDPDSRERYLEAVRESAEDHGFGWAMWSHLGLLDDEDDRLLSLQTVRALGLDMDAASAMRTIPTADREDTH